MMVLAGLEQLQIRALFSQTSAAVSLRRVALEVASEIGRGPPASNVELCMCPANYRGDSCQVKSGQGGCLAMKVPTAVGPSRLYFCQHLLSALSHLRPRVSSSPYPASLLVQSTAPSSPVTQPFIAVRPSIHSSCHPSPTAIIPDPPGFPARHCSFPHWCLCL